MQCPRCNGLMIRERFEDFLDDSGQVFFYGLRCLHCGEVLDPRIIKNRKGVDPFINFLKLGQTG